MHNSYQTDTNRDGHTDTDDPNYEDATAPEENGGKRTSNEAVSLSPTPSPLCGYGRWTPNCLQRCHSIRGLCAAICCFAFVQGFAVNGITNVNTATLERRFELSSVRVAWITVAYDLAGGVFAIIVGCIGGKTHNGRLMALGAVSMAIGSFVMFVPHVASDSYDLGQRETEVCTANGTTTCSVGADGPDWLFVFIVGQVFHAAGSATLFIIGVTYMDANVTDKTRVPLYIGLLHAFSVVGPAIAFFLGGQLLNIYVDIGSVDMNSISVTPDDPRWVGAWWVGYVLTCGCALCVAALLACFARHLPTKPLDQKEKEEKEPGPPMLQSLRSLLTSPVYILLTLAGIVEVGLITGFATFITKFIQFQFAKSASDASIYAGALIVPGGAIGQIVGGLIPRWTRAGTRELLIQSCVCSGVAGLAAIALLLVCEQPLMSGIHVHYDNLAEMKTPDLSAGCNANCSCSAAGYAPVCGSNHVGYFTPCHAGCTHTLYSGGMKYYTNCSCITPDNNNTSPSLDLLMTSSSPIGDVMGDGWAREGVCKSDCKLFPAYMVLFFILILATFMSNTSGQAATVRVMSDGERSLGFGVQWSLVRFLGNVPGPIVIGAILDASCIMWQTECDVQGSCWIYNSQSMATGICVTTVVVKALSGIFFGLAAILQKDSPKSILNDINENDNLQLHQQVLTVETHSGNSSSFSNGIDCKTDTGKNKEKSSYRDESHEGRELVEQQTPSDIPDILHTTSL